MKTIKIFLSAVIIVLPAVMYAQNTEFSKTSTSSLTRGAALLFKNIPTKLSAADQNFIYQQMNFVLSADTSQPFASDKESMEYPFTAQVWPTDMNKDGKEEVFIVFGNSFTSGMTGSSVVLYIKNTAGKYVLNLGFPGNPSAMPTSNLGYRDYLLAGQALLSLYGDGTARNIPFSKPLKTKRLKRSDPRKLRN